jgi:glycosyltransferase involved in cell wall biosynthesis
MGMVRAMREMGHTVAICSPPGCDPERKQTARERPAPAEGPLRRLLKRFARKAPPLLFELFELAYNAWSLVAMLRLARRRRPDLIYERTTANSVTPTYLARRWKVPIVQEVNVTTEIGRLRPLVLRDVTQRLEHWTIRHARLFVAVTEEFRRQLVVAGFPAEKIIVCQNAVDPSAFDPETVQPAGRPEGVEPGSLVVGYVGAFVPYHRVDALVEAARVLQPEWPQARWLLVGDGVDRPKIEALLRDYGLASRFWMPGPVTHRQVPSYVMAMDIAVLPSSNPHGSAMKLFEYMGMGKAVVAPRVPAVAEVIRDGENGLLFEPGDAGALVLALRRAMQDGALRERIGRTARQSVLANYTWRRNAERVLAMLQ